ncbi:MAG: chemotaxis protein CheX [Kiritimatiellae bacterium]|nr:chemotaxis protein CheX [Kiritimatiellia bacterium]MDD4734546.1 chemotaxis protein CheX [Kiritimatiellia bacterium]
MTKTIQELYPAFVESVQEIFETMVFMPITAEEPLPGAHEPPRGGIAGSLSVTGDELTINLSLVFGTDLAFSIFRAMMGMEESEPVEIEEVSDIVGELANMTSGGAKTRLQEEYPHLQLGLPSVVVGQELYVDPPKNAQTVVIPLIAGSGKFFLEISLSA